MTGISGFKHGVVTTGTDPFFDGRFVDPTLNFIAEPHMSTARFGRTTCRSPLRDERQRLAAPLLQHDYKSSHKFQGSSSNKLISFDDWNLWNDWNTGTGASV